MSSDSEYADFDDDDVRDAQEFYNNALMDLDADAVDNLMDLDRIAQSQPPKEPATISQPAEYYDKSKKEDKLKFQPVLPKKNVPFGQEGHRFRFPTNSHVLIVGPTQAGKTSFVKKLFIDGFDHPLGSAPFDKIIYVGVEGETNDFSVAAQTMNWTYAKIEPGTSKSIPVFWLPKNEIDKLPSIVKSEENKNLKKLIIVDDSLKGNGTEKIAKILFSLLGEGQHDNAWYIVIGHTAAGFKGLKNQCNVRILFKDSDTTDYSTMFGNKPSPFYANLVNHLKSFNDVENSLTKFFCIYSVLQDTFYDYNLNKINI